MRIQWRRMIVKCFIDVKTYNFAHLPQCHCVLDGEHLWISRNCWWTLTLFKCACKSMRLCLLICLITDVTFYRAAFASEEWTHVYILCVNNAWESFSISARAGPSMFVAASNLWMWITVKNVSLNLCNIKLLIY